MRPPGPREVEDEIAFQIEMTILELVAGGMSHENARLEAAHPFGDTGIVNAECQELTSSVPCSRSRSVVIGVPLKC
jgi:hypothetical protein